MDRLTEALNRFLNWASALSTSQKVGILFSVFALFALSFSYRLVNEITPGPCSPGGYPARCYYITEKLCNYEWTRAKAKCEDFVHKQSLRPGRLLGPIVFYCQLSSLDSAFPYSRKSGEECDQKHADLMAWKRRNGF